MGEIGTPTRYRPQPSTQPVRLEPLLVGFARARARGNVADLSTLKLHRPLHLPCLLGIDLG